MLSPTEQAAMIDMLHHVCNRESDEEEAGGIGVFRDVGENVSILLSAGDLDLEPADKPDEPADAPDEGSAA